jgi:hypothetical protein
MGGDGEGSKRVYYKPYSVPWVRKNFIGRERRRRMRKVRRRRRRCFQSTAEAIRGRAH